MTKAMTSFAMLFLSKTPALNATTTKIAISARKNSSDAPTKRNWKSDSVPSLETSGNESPICGIARVDVDNRLDGSKVCKFKTIEL